MKDTPTPETDDALDAVSRTPDGMYDSRVPISEYAYAMAQHSRKMERERDSLTDQRDCALDLISTLTRERDEAREYSDRLAEAALRLAYVAEQNTDDGDLWQAVINHVRVLVTLNKAQP